MWEQVCHRKDRVALPFADRNGERLPILFHNYPMQCKRDRPPLVLFDPTVIVGFEQGNLPLLIERAGFEVEPRGVDMARHNPHPVDDRAGADRCKDERLAAVVVINPITRTVGGMPAELPESRVRSHAHDLGNRFPLGFAPVEESLVRLAERLGCLFCVIVVGHAHILAVQQQFFLQKFACAFLIFHLKYLPYLSDSQPVKAAVDFHCFVHPFDIRACVRKRDIGDILPIGRVLRVVQPLLDTPPAPMVCRKRIVHCAELVEQHPKHLGAVVDTGRGIKKRGKVVGFGFAADGSPR